MAPISNAVALSGEPTLTLLHGFTNTSETWGTFRTHLAQAYGVKALDLPGHGENHAVRQNLRDAAHSLAFSLDEPTVLIGYSLGGRIALHCALEQPRNLRGLVLLGATAGIEDDDERATRRQSDEMLAANLRESNNLEAFLKKWLDGPLFSRLSQDQRQLKGRLHNTVEGLSSSLELMGVGTQASLWGELHRLSVPTLIVAGDEDEKFTALGLRLAAAISKARFVGIAGAGHTVHVEQPELTAQVVLRFVEELSPQAVSGPDDETS